MYFKQLTSQCPQRVFVLIVRKIKRRVESLVLVLQSKGIVAVQVIVRGEQEENLSYAKVRSIDLGEYLGEAQGVRREGVPVVGSATGIEACQARERVKVRRDELDELRRSVATLVPSLCVMLNAVEELTKRPCPLARTFSNPESQQVRSVSSSLVQLVVSFVC